MNNPEGTGGSIASLLNGVVFWESIGIRDRSTSSREMKMNLKLKNPITLVSHISYGERFEQINTMRGVFERYMCRVSRLK